MGLIDAMTCADALVEDAVRNPTDAARIDRIVSALRAIGFADTADTVLRYHRSMVELHEHVGHSVKV